MKEGHITQSTLDARIKELEEQVNNLEYQIAQRDKTIAKAHKLLVLEKFYYPENESLTDED
tara:strand:+ start:1322 stop:1504 length:183 start_codon:yes stop_codon:yes gene_type:complete